jgi:hypothetical protein
VGERAVNVSTRVAVVVVAWTGVVGVGVVMTTQATADPRPWTSLSEAAAKPAGIGDRGVAEGVRGSDRSDTAVRSVLPSPEAGSGGCERAYGDGGQCLPVVPPSQAEHVAGGHGKAHWSCKEVRRYFADGLVVAEVGVDPLDLDRDEDGTACGVGD